MVGMMYTPEQIAQMHEDVVDLSAKHGVEMYPQETWDFIEKLTLDQLRVVNNDDGFGGPKLQIFYKDRWRDVVRTDLCDDICTGLSVAECLDRDWWKFEMLESLKEE